MSSEDIVYIQKSNGDMNGSLNRTGKNHVPTAMLSRQLHLGYPIEITPEVDLYLSLRKKYDKAEKVFSDQNNSLEVRNAYRHEMVKTINEVHALDLDAVLTGWEIYEKEREDTGLTVDELPYEKTVLEALARSIEEGVVNPDSIENFIPPRYKEFKLSNGYSGYDVSYEDHINGIHPHIPKGIIVGANIDFIHLNIKSDAHKSYVPFHEGKESVGFPEGQNSIKEGEKVYFALRNLDVLKAEIAEKPRLTKIRSLRFIFKPAGKESEEK